LDGLHTTGQAISTLFKLKSRKAEHFYQDFKGKYEKVQPLAEKLHASMSEFKNEKEEMAKKINESDLPNEDKVQYLKDVKSAYDGLEEYLIPIPYRLETMKEAMTSMKAFDESSKFDPKLKNRQKFIRAYNDVFVSIAAYKILMGIINGINIDMDDEIKLKHGNMETLKNDVSSNEGK
jgi:hypothetical protein